MHWKGPFLVAYQTIQLSVVAALRLQAKLIARKLHQQLQSATFTATAAGLQKLQIKSFAGVAIVLEQNPTNQTRSVDFKCQKLVTAFLSIVSRTSFAYWHP